VKDKGERGGESESGSESRKEVESATKAKIYVKCLSVLLMMMVL
jgi:hypothetical protein